MLHLLRSHLNIWELVCQQVLHFFKFHGNSAYSVTSLLHFGINFTSPEVFADTVLPHWKNYECP